MEWTKEQKQAIVDNGANILVSAAAGSGKTTVLISRIIHKITEENVDIDKLLVVTFTNAAASEMKERLLNKLYEKIDEDPMNVNLQKQINLISHAHISTIHSFCLDVIRNNFFEIGVSANFRVGDETEIEIMKEEAIEKVFEDNYENGNEDFQTLLKMYTTYKDDQPLKDLILKLYDFISSVPNPEKWLDDAINDYDVKDTNFADTKWGKIIIEYTQNEIKGYVKNLEQAKRSLDGIPNLVDFYINLQNEINFMNSIDYSNWNKIYTQINSKEKNDWPRKSKLTEEEKELKENAKKVRDDVKKDFEKKIQKLYVYSSEEAIQDIKDMQRVLKMIQKLLNEFITEFQARKKDKNVVDFSDIEHLALKILVNEDGSKTDVAKKYDFNEIMCDEYQDSNLLQEQILKSVSNGHNIFMVGDVKQSIYRFRQAMPKLFLDKYSNYKPVENDTNCIGRKIQLFKNFRSRDNVLDFTNLIFKDIMSQKLGEVDYTEDEYLNFGAEDYKKINQNLKTEIDIIDVKPTDETEEYLSNKYSENIGDNEESEEELEHLENIEIEAKHVARKIKNLINSKYQVYDRKKETFRNITYKDIAILLRSTKDKASIYEQELIKLDMPVFADSNQEYLDSIEIQTIMSLLKIIDNPMQDIPLVTVLRSNIGKFTDNELVEIRLSDKYDNFYNCMQKAKVDVNSQLKEKIEKFLNQIDLWRKEQEYLSLDELIWKIYSDTGYYNYVGLMPNGNLRQANLKMLFERAKKYETASFKGLYNFINFIEKLKINSGDLSSAKIIGENDDVIRIMSIHKSKGLEFPVVFLVNTNKQFNEQDIRKNPVLLHQELGIGAKYINYNAQVQYDTLTREAIKNVVRNENISEEMRILYVALTRAKEKLIITGISNDYQKQLEDIEQQKNIYARKDGKINPILVKKYKSYLDWILLVYLYEQSNTEDLLELNKIEPGSVLENKKQDIEQEKTSQNIIDMLNKKANKNDVNQVRNQIEYEYPNKLAIDIPTKSSVTKIKQMKQKQLGVDFESMENEVEQEKSITFEKPKFLQDEKENKITSAQKGTLTHLCLQRLNPKEEYDLEEIKSLIQNLEMNQIITEKESEAINPYKILQFTKSEIWNQLKNAKEYYQEKPFYINVPAKQIYDEDIKENILVQGIIDLYFVNESGQVVLVDYKTDYVENGNEIELVDKYKSQMDLYKKALESALGIKVDKVYIYSVYLGKEIEIK